VKNPATADGFTVIFQKARDNKKTTGPGQSGIPPAFRNANGNGYGYGSGSPYKTGNSYPYSRVASPKRIKVPTFAYRHAAMVRFSQLCALLSDGRISFICRRSGSSAAASDCIERQG
jgi:hypothetical protein